MISFEGLDVSDYVIITCVDGERLQGTIISMEDEEESGIGEIAVIIATNDKRHVVIGRSEITSTQVIL